MYTFSNSYLANSLNEEEWGSFIEPDKELENFADPNDKYKLARGSNYWPDYSPFIGAFSAFDSIVSRIEEQRKKFTFEDQCSAKYYFDVFNLLRLLVPKGINKVIDVGVFMGGSASILAGCIENTDIQLDLIDFGKEYLRISYERIRRIFPEVAKRTRLFLGDLPTYTHHVLIHENDTRNLVHHDASHNFNEVVRDLASLSFVKERIEGLIIQDTHLRGGNVGTGFFVDAALYAVFGGAMPFYELGIKLNAATEPAFQQNSFGIYFIDNQAEGMYIPFELVNFRYPHPNIKLEMILPQAEFKA